MELQHKTDDAPGSYSGHGVNTTPGEIVDVDEDDGEALLETGYFERADEATDANTADDGAANAAGAPFDPRELTIDEIRQELDGEEYAAAQMVALADLEHADQNRDGAIDLLSPTAPQTPSGVGDESDGDEADDDEDDDTDSDEE